MGNLNTRRIKSIDEFIRAVRDDSNEWAPEVPKWFRGEPESGTALVPSLYRHPESAQHENALLQTFRTRASGYYEVVPNRDHTDQWLFLARHAGLPTRLLDWSEGALIALHFALKEEKPVVWVLNPLQLNARTYGKLESEFPLVWVRPETGINPAFENVAGAWTLDQQGVDLPIAFHPGYVHARLRSQRSCFTVHGKHKSGLNTLVDGSVLRRYDVDPASRPSMMKELTVLGITESVVFPDIDGLATELKEQFGFGGPD